MCINLGESQACRISDVRVGESRTWLEVQHILREWKSGLVNVRSSLRESVFVESVFNLRVESSTDISIYIKRYCLLSIRK